MDKASSFLKTGCRVWLFLYLALLSVRAFVLFLCFCIHKDACADQVTRGAKTHSLPRYSLLPVSSSLQAFPGPLNSPVSFTGLSIFLDVFRVIRTNPREKAETRFSESQPSSCTVCPVGTLPGVSVLALTSASQVLDNRHMPSLPAVTALHTVWSLSLVMGVLASGSCGQ